MRALLLALVVFGTACTTDTLAEDTAYRRLVDDFDTEAQCLADGNFAVCYQTLTLCSSGLVRMDLVNRPQNGEYKLHDGIIAVAQFIDMHVEFDLEARTSAQLPGRHAWAEIQPITYDCK
jgi:hypothetical protein